MHSAADGTRKLVFRLTVRHAPNSGFQLLLGGPWLGCRAAASPVGPLWTYRTDAWYRHKCHCISKCQNGLLLHCGAFCRPVGRPARGCFRCYSLVAAALPPDTCRTVTLLQTGEGAGFHVETVLIPVVRSQGRRPRTTLCISSQVGCAMNCQFCFTGRMGLK